MLKLSLGRLSGSEVMEPLARRGCDRFGLPNGGFPPELDVLEHDLHPALERHFGVPTEHVTNAGSVGKRAVRLPRTFGNVHRLSAEQFDQAIDAVRATGT